MSSTPATAVVTLNATLTDSANNPIGGVPIVFNYELATATSWTSIGTVTTSSSGFASTQVTVNVPAAYNFEAVFAGNSTYNGSSAQVTDLIIKANTALTLVVVP